MTASGRYMRTMSSLQSFQFSHIFVYLLFLSSVNVCVSTRRCDIDRCGNHYRSITEKDDPAKRCRLLSLHSDCLTKMNMACRGNLLYHTSVHISEKQLEIWNCSQSSPNSPHARNHGPTRTNQCIYAEKPEYRFCSLFGDPHVRTFADRFHTCKANGSWKLVNNDYLLVKAINSPLPGQLRATAITELVVVIRRSGACAKKRVYRAAIAQQLPHKFVDGSTHTGTNKSVNITVKDQGKEVQIDLRFIATTVVIRHAGSHLAFSIQMPDEIVDRKDRSEQMCVRGCPRRQRILLAREIRRLTSEPEDGAPEQIKYTEPEARRKCQHVLLRDRDDETEVANRRTKRSNGRSSKRSRQKKDTEQSASAASWNQLFDHPRDILRPRSPARSRKTRSRQRNVGSRRREFDLEFVHDDPGIGRRRNRVVSSVTRGTNFYFDACVFDLMTTGDVAYASSARGAFDDVTRFHRSGSNAKGASKVVIVNWTDVDTTSKPSTTSTNKVSVGQTASVVYDINTTSSAPAKMALNFSSLLFLLSAIHFLNDFNFLGGCLYACISFFNSKQASS